MSVNANEKILRLKVSIDDVSKSTKPLLRMNVIKSNKDFKEVELSLSLFHSFDFFELVKELSSRTV